MKNGYRAAPILVALLVLFVGMLGSVSLVNAQVLGTVALKVFSASPAAGDANVVWATTDPTGSNAVNSITIHVNDADLSGAARVTTTVTSDSDGVGIEVGLTPVSATFFTGSFSLTPSTSTGSLATSTGSYAKGTALLAADHGDTVKVVYSDQSTPFGVSTREDTLTVDAEGPEFDNLDPADGTVISTVSTYTIDITDVDSAVSVGRVTFKINQFVNDMADSRTSDGPTTSTTAIRDADDVDIGFTFEMSVGLSGDIWIGITAEDTAGNVTSFDADESTPLTIDMAAIIIDTSAPAYDAAYTGIGWDNIAKALTTDSGSILVTFDEDLTDLDASTVSKGDFSVEGHSVTDADVFDNDPVTSTVDGLDNPLPASVSLFGTVNMRRVVILTLASDLAPDETPEVALVGNRIDNDAGATALTHSEDAQDRIAPTITIDSITPELAGDGDTVVIKISSDEALRDDPAVTITNAVDHIILRKTIDTDGTNAWKVTTVAVGSGGAYSIYITGEDEERNAETVGADPATWAAGVGETALDDDHTVFEGDVELLAPRVTPADATEAVTRDPFFIIIDFGETTTGDLLRDEGSEYNADDFTTVKLTVLKLDGVDILGDEDSKDDVKFLIAINDIALGEHIVVVNAEDEAGNTLSDDLTVTFDVAERVLFGIDLNPGWNLVSFPGDPADGDIEVVLADVSSVTAIVTYDPALPGGFLSAIREEGDSFAGTLTTVVRGRGYWINADTFETLEVDIPALEAGEVGLLPPTIAISEGWNLVPVLDVVGTGSAGEHIAAATYFGSIVGEIAAVYSYDTISNSWEFVDHNGTVAADGVELGRAYWVYATAAGVLVPSGEPE